MRHEKTTNSSKNIAIIGAGPTGIFTALLLRDFKGEVNIFDKNADVGEKLKLTGGGRMNVMNRRFSSADFFSNSPLKSAERLKNNFFKTQHARPENLKKIFQQLRVDYTWEKNRAMLTSESAKEEVARLHEELIQQKNCTIHLDQEITKISPQQDDSFVLETSAGQFKADSVVVSTGGMFQIGEQCNTEKTYKFPQELGHNISKITPSLSPFRLKYHLLLPSSGIALPATLFSGKCISQKAGIKKYESEITDSLLITHFGISGPAVLDFSAIWNGTDKVFLNFLPEFSQTQFQKLLSEKRAGGNSVVKFLQTFLPNRLAENICAVIKCEEKNIADFSKQEEENFINSVFAFDISKITIPEKMPYQGCWTTKGGVLLDTINVSTLESKIQKNLFFGGELLDIDGLCGGYHISLAAMCGKIISEKLLK